MVLAVPGFVVAMLSLFGRDGPRPAPRWAYRALGVAVLAVGVLFVLGVIGV